MAILWAVASALAFSAFSWMVHETPIADTRSWFFVWLMLFIAMLSAALSLKHLARG